MFQQVILIGNLGDAPALRYTPAGIPVANFNLAVNRRWSNADGQPQEKTNWFQVTAWRRQAELANQYLAKGSRVMILGDLDGARPWTDREGNLRATINVVANEIKFLDSRPNGRDTEEVNGNSQVETLEAAPADIPF